MNTTETEVQTPAEEGEPFNPEVTTGEKQPEPERGSGSGRVRRSPYTRDFRTFLEQLGESRLDFDQFRRGLWDTFQPEDSFEDDLFEDLVENRWELRRVKRTRQAKLVEIRRRKELHRQQHLASEGRGVSGKAHKYIMREEGVSSLPDSEYKFGRTILFLIALRARVELEGFTEWGLQCLTVVFGEKPGLFSGELVLGYEAGRKAEAQGDQHALESARRSFLVALEEEITAYRKLQALYREGAIEIPEATRGADLLLEEKDLDKLLRQERMLELQYQLKLEQWSAWRWGKQRAAVDGPKAVPDFGAVRGGIGRQLATGRESVGKKPGRPAKATEMKV